MVFFFLYILATLVIIRYLQAILDSYRETKTFMSIIAAKVFMAPETQEYILKQLLLAEEIEKNFKVIFGELSRPENQRIGQILLSKRYVNPEDLKDALMEQKRHEHRGTSE